MDSKGELQELDEKQLPELRSKIVFRAVLTRVYETVYARNTYGGASGWGGLYPYSAGFSLGQADAKRRASAARVQGSTWTVKGLPVIAFVSDDLSLIVAEVDA